MGIARALGKDAIHRIKEYIEKGYTRAVVPDLSEIEEGSPQGGNHSLLPDYNFSAYGLPCIIPRQYC